MNSLPKNPQKLPTEEDEEGFLNPEDLSLVDERTWEPSDEEILSYALKLGYDIDKDPDELFEVAYYYMKYPLPEGWKRAIYKNTKELMYVNMEDGEIELSTEIEEMARQMYLAKKEEMFKKSDKGENVTKVVPRSKIPPINQLEKSDNSVSNKLQNVKEKDIKNNESNSEIDVEKKNENEKKNKNNDDIIGASESIKKEEKVEDKKEEKKENKKEKKKLKEDSDDEYGDFDFDGIEDDSDSDSNKEDNVIKSIINKEKEEILKLENQKKEEEEMKKKKEEEEMRKKKEEEEEIRKKREEEEMKIKKEEEEMRKKKEEEEKRIKKEEEEMKLKIEKMKQEKEKENLLNKKKEEELRLQKQKEIEKEKILEKLNSDKKEYLTKKLEELKEYKESIKNKYERDKQNYELKKQNFEEEYNTKLETEIKKAKNKYQKQFNEKLELLETQLINKKLKEEKKYKDDLKSEYDEKKQELISSKEKTELQQKNNLQQKKNKLLKEIEEEKKEILSMESNITMKKENLIKNKKLFDEKNILEKQNIEKNHELEIKNYEIASQTKLSKIKSELKGNIFSNRTSSSQLNFSMSGINDGEDDSIKTKIIENIQKALENEYEINCKSYEQELINTKIKDLEKYTNTMNQEKNDKINFYKNEILSTEKDYYKSISNIRELSNRKKNEGDSKLNSKFEQALTEYEGTKQKIVDDNKNLMNLFIEGAQKLIIKNNSMEQTEIHIEEFIADLKDSFLLNYQKNKNTYEMCELDYKYKKEFIKYLLSVINYLTKTFSISNNLMNNDKDTDNNKYLADNLLTFCKDQINIYKKKFQSKKKNKIYKFLNDSLFAKSNNSFDYLNYSDNTKETNTLFVNSFKRANNNLINSTPIENITSNNFVSKIDINKSINNILNNRKTKNSFSPYFSANNFFSNTINDCNNELDYYTVDNNSDFLIPLIHENILENLDEEILMLYSEITLFLKNEYLKILQLNSWNNGQKINTKLNLLILNKIKIFAEESFIFIVNNYEDKDQIPNIKKKLIIVQNHINDFKINFNIDKYLQQNNDTEGKSNNNTMTSYNWVKFNKNTILNNNTSISNINTIINNKKYFDEENQQTMTNDEIIKKCMSKSNGFNGFNNMILNGNN